MKIKLTIIFLAIGVFMASRVSALDVSKLDIGEMSVSTLKFPKDLSEVTIGEISSDSGLKNIKGLDSEKVVQFLSKLCEEGYSEINGTDEECRPVCVTAQGAIEEGLAKMLNSKELKDVKSIILTPLPCTPLRKNGDTTNLSNVSFDEARQYTLNMREHTLRALRDAGAKIIVAYSKDTYADLEAKKDDGSCDQVENWEKEKKHPRVVDLPLNRNVSDDVVGALYLITDKEGNKFYLPVQSIQAKSVTESVSTWKMYFGSNEKSSLGVDRALKMLEYIEANGGEKIEF